MTEQPSTPNRSHLERQNAQPDLYKRQTAPLASIPVAMAHLKDHSPKAIESPQPRDKQKRLTPPHGVSADFTQSQSVAPSNKLPIPLTNVRIRNRRILSGRSASQDLSKQPLLTVVIDDHSAGDAVNSAEAKASPVSNVYSSTPQTVPRSPNLPTPHTPSSVHGSPRRTDLDIQLPPSAVDSKSSGTSLKLSSSSSGARSASPSPAAVSATAANLMGADPILNPTAVRHRSPLISEGRKARVENKSEVPPSPTAAPSERAVSSPVLDDPSKSQRAPVKASPVAATRKTHTAALPMLSLPQADAKQSVSDSPKVSPSRKPGDKTPTSSAPLAVPESKQLPGESPKAAPRRATEKAPLSTPDTKQTALESPKVASARTAAEREKVPPLSVSAVKPTAGEPSPKVSTSARKAEADTPKSAASTTRRVNDGRSPVPPLSSVDLAASKGADTPKKSSARAAGPDSSRPHVPPLSTADLKAEPQKIHSGRSAVSGTISTSTSLTDYELAEELTVLQQAASTGDVGRVTALLSDPSTPIDVHTKRGRTALMLACRNGHAAIVGKLISAGASLTVADDMGNTPLLHAADKGHLEAVKLVLSFQTFADKKGFSSGSTHARLQQNPLLKQRNLKKNNALFLAVGSGCLPLVEYLIDSCGLSVSDTNGHGSTPFLHAAFTGQEQVLKCLLTKYKVVATDRDEGKNNAILKAAAGGHLGVMKFLVLNSKCTFSDRNKDGDTVLTIAAGKGHLEIVKYLVNECPELINERNTKKMTVAIQAAYEGKSEVVKYLLDRQFNSFESVDSSGRNCLMAAARRGHAELMRWLLYDLEVPSLTPQAKADQRDGAGNNLFMLAAEKGQIDIVRFLLSSDSKLTIDLTARNNAGETAFLVAAATGQMRVIELLYQRSLETVLRLPNPANLPANKIIPPCVREKDNKQNTALLIAASYGQLKAVRFLLEHHESLIVDKNDHGRGCTALAAIGGHLDVVKYLLDGGKAWIEDKDATQRSVVMLAAKFNREEVMRYLVENKASLKGRDAHDDTVVLHASASMSAAAVEFLVKKGASLDDRNAKGYTPFLVACATGNLPVVKYIDTAMPNAIEARDAEHASGFLLAIRNKHVHVVEYLLEVSRSIATKDFAIVVAARTMPLSVIQQLVKAGAKPNDKNRAGDTPLHVAARFQRHEIVAFLLSQPGVDIKERNGKGETAYLIAAAEGDVALVSYLREKAPQVPELLEADKKGNTALHLAAMNGRLGVVKYLVKSRFPLKTVNLAQCTALQVAANTSFSDVIEYLQRVSGDQ